MYVSTTVFEYHSRCRFGFCAMMSLSCKIQPGWASAPSHCESEMMMLYSWLRVASEVAAFWNRSANGASAKAKDTP